MNQELDVLAAALDRDAPMPEPRQLDLPLLPTGQTERFYLERFMRQFDEDWNGTAVIEAPTGHRLMVSSSLFTDHKTGRTKINKEGRAAYLDYLAATIKEPDEIRLHEGSHGDRALYLLGRFIVKGKIMNTLAVFKADHRTWIGWTGYQTFRADYFESKRNDVPIYRRSQT